MKRTDSAAGPVVALEAEAAGGASALGDFAILTKARLSLMVVFTTAIGYIVGAAGRPIGWGLLFAVLGTSLAAASAGALNQWMEADVDRLMERTRNRPLPAGRMRPVQALWVGIALGVLGVGELLLTLPRLAAWLALATIGVYLVLYTPLKRKSAWCTYVGAVSGAIPPVIGWSAAEPTEAWGGWVLFGILFLWQIPHFLAIAWMYRDEYRGAGFVMIKSDDEDGFVTALQAFCFALALAAVTLIPAWIGQASTLYRGGAVLLNLLFCGSALVFLLERSRVSARRLFFMSITFLPVLLGLLAFSRRQ
jgi:protoheme IX farnesyltransferase